MRDDDSDPAAGGVARLAADLELLARRRCALGTFATVCASMPSKARSPGTASTSAAASSDGVAPPAPSIPIVPPAPITRTRRA